MINKKAQLTPVLRATAQSFKDGGCSKMAISRHLGYYRTGNSAIRSADPENPCLEPDMEWIGSPLNYTVTLKLGFGVTQGYRKCHIRYNTYIFIAYLSSIVTIPLSITVSEI